MKNIDWKNIHFTRKAKVQAMVVGAVALGMLLFATAQMVGIGQAYQCVNVNGEMLGYTSAQTDVKEVIQSARREISIETGERLCIELDWTSEMARRPFQKLMPEDELKDLVKDMIAEECMMRSPKKVCK